MVGLSGITSPKIMGRLGTTLSAPTVVPHSGDTLWQILGVVLHLTPIGARLETVEPFCLRLDRLHDDTVKEVHHQRCAEKGSHKIDHRNHAGQRNQSSSQPDCAAIVASKL